MFQTIGDEHQIPDNVVTRILEDTQGFLWIGTPSGLIRYDGYRFKRYLHSAAQDNSLGGNFIVDLTLDADGNLWIISEPGGVAMYRPQQDDFQRLTFADDATQRRLTRYARTLISDEQGLLWLGGRDGFMSMDRLASTAHFYEFDNTTASALTQVRALISINNSIFIGAKEGLFMFDQGSQRLDKLPLPFDSNNAVTQVLSLTRGTDDSLWIGTANQGLFRLNLTNGYSEKVASGTNKDNETAINDMLQVDEHTLWLARFDGIDAVNTTDKRWLGKVSSDSTSRYSLVHSDMRSLFKDSAGQIWLGGYGSGVKLYQRHQAISVLNASVPGPFNLEYDNISSVLERSNGEIWLGSRGDGISILHPEQGIIKHYGVSPGDNGTLQQGWITTMLEHGDEIWLGANPGQLYRFSTRLQRFEAVDATSGFWFANVRRLFRDRKQRLWLATNEGAALWHEPTGQFQRIRLPDGKLITDYINGFADDQQQLWLATGTSGLLSITNTSLVATPARFSADSPALPNSILGLLYDKQRRLWLDTPEGLFVIADTTRQPLELRAATMQNQPLANDMGANLLQDEQGRIWTQRYLYYPDSGRLYDLTPADGVYHGTNWYRAYTQTRDGLMLFGGSQGLLIVTPDKFEPWQYTPQVQATAVQIDGRSVRPEQGSLVVAADARSFSVEFAALDLSAPDKIQYRYQLIGFDDNWRYTDAPQRQASYTNLWPGEYQLRIEATNRSQIWSPHAYQLTVKVQAAYWQTPWFMLLMLSGLGAALYAVVRYRTRLLSRQAKALEQQVASRTAELQRTQKALSEKEKMAALGQLVAGIAHEINTPLGISITASSLQQETTGKLQQLFERKQLTSTQLQQYIEQTAANLELLLSNLQRSADLVQTFKEVAVDNSMLVQSHVHMLRWLEERTALLGSLSDNIALNIDCDANLTLQLPSKALEAVLLQLMKNSVIHGFAERACGTIFIRLHYEAGQCTMLYHDNGAGVADEVRHTLFDPFVTTRRGSHCKGLGLHLCFNLVTQVLGGSIILVDSGQTGAAFKLVFAATKLNNEG